MINVTKANLPSLHEYIKYLEGIWDRAWLTNYGPLVQELEAKLKEYLEVNYFQYVSNGTIALQLAIKALDLKGEIITTPFSYVATTTSILWENCTPVFVDIEDKTFCIDPAKIEEAINERTCAILATHVYGFPCEVERINDIAAKYNLKVVYDGAHAFGVRVNDKSIFSYGDISTLSFHATKLFHTIEGGGVISRSQELDEKIFLYKSFGHKAEDYISIGINGKNSEFHAAMGLCNLPMVSDFINARKKLFELYKGYFEPLPLLFPEIPKNIKYNYAYFPVIFPSENEMLLTKEILAGNGVNTRRYFYPSLNNLPYFRGASCPISENISQRILCLPMYQELMEKDVEKISKLIIKSFVIA